MNLALRPNSGVRAYFFRLLSIRCTKCQSSSLTWLFAPGHRLCPIWDAKRSQLNFYGLCILSRPVPGHRHFHDFGWRSSFSTRVCLAVHSEQTIFACFFDSMYFRRVSYGNVRCPRSPHSSHRYNWTSFGDIPLLWQSLHTRLRFCHFAFSNIVASNALSASSLSQALHVHC